MHGLGVGIFSACVSGIILDFKCVQFVILHVRHDSSTGMLLRRVGQWVSHSVYWGQLTVVWSVYAIFFEVFISTHGDKWKIAASEYETSFVRGQCRSKHCLQRHLDTSGKWGENNCLIIDTNKHISRGTWSSLQRSVTTIQSTYINC